MGFGPVFNRSLADGFPHQVVVRLLDALTKREASYWDDDRLTVGTFVHDRETRHRTRIDPVFARVDTITERLVRLLLAVFEINLFVRRVFSE